MAVEDTSLRTEIETMSEGFISLKSDTASSTPSTTISGLLPASIDLEPRTRIFAPSPGSPVVDMNSAPATLPWSACATDVIGALVRSSASTTDTAPVRSLFLDVPYPMTTTFSSCSIDGFMLTLTTFLPSTGTRAFS